MASYGSNLNLCMLIRTHLNPSLRLRTIRIELQTQTRDGKIFPNPKQTLKIVLQHSAIRGSRKGSFYFNKYFQLITNVSKYIWIYLWKRFTSTFYFIFFPQENVKQFTAEVESFKLLRIITLTFCIKRDNIRINSFNLSQK